MMIKHGIVNQLTHIAKVDFDANNEEITETIINVNNQDENTEDN